jgi:hypothetical protein
MNAPRERDWEDFETNFVIDCLLKQQSEAGYKGELDRLALLNGRTDGDVVERFIWGLCVRLRDYTATTLPFVIRHGPPTWCELHWLELASGTRSKEAMEKRTAPPDAAYLAPLLRRTLADTQALWDKYGPSRGRGAGFGVARPGFKEPK